MAPPPYISEIKYLGSGNADFVEIAVPQGTDVSAIRLVVYNPDGSVRTDNALGSVDGTMAGRDVYTIDKASSPTFTGVNQNGAVALVVNGSVVQFLSFNGPVTATEGPANGTTSTALGATARGESWETSDNGASYDVQSSPTPGTVPCFVAGTRIAVPGGYRPVERLAPGDLVWTEDDGYQPILWTGCRTLTEDGDPSLRPIRIPAGAIAPGVPQRDVQVSPNHRLALSHPFCALYFQSGTVLAPARALSGHRGIGPVRSSLPVSYHHLLLPRHAIIRAEGMATKSFLPEAMGLAALTPADRADLLAELEADGITDRRSARLIITPAEARLLLRSLGADPRGMTPGGTRAHAA